MENTLRELEYLSQSENEKSPQVDGTTSEETKHDYEYLQSILSDHDIGRLKHAIKVGRPIIVEGIQGPTGKSVLVSYLKERSVQVIEYGLAEVFTLNEFLEERNPNPFKSSFPNAR